MNKRLLPWIRKNLKKIAGYGAGGAMALVLAGCATTPTTSSASLAACKPQISYPSNFLTPLG